MRSAGPHPTLNLNRNLPLRIRKVKPPPPRRRKAVFSDRLLTRKFVEEAPGEKFEMGWSAVNLILIRHNSSLLLKMSFLRILKAGERK